MDIDALESTALEMDAAALLIDAAGANENLSVADIGPGLHALIRRWCQTIARAAASARAADDSTETLTVELTSSEADALRARAAAHAVTPEAEILLLVDAAMQRAPAGRSQP